MSEDQGSESIYRAPESETSVAPVGDQMAAFVGPRYESFYADKFAKFERGGSASWNWPAFFLTAFWLLYRKMWAYGLSYWFLLPIVLATLATVVAFTVSDPVNSLIAFNIIYYGIYSVLSLIIVPMYANRLYYRHAQKKMARVALRFPSPDQQALELARAGGTSNVVLIILPLILVALIGIIAAISIPAYQDYTVRAQVSEGLNLSSGAKAAVTEYYLDSGELPADNMTAGLEAPRNISGMYVSSVQVQDGVIIVTYGKDAHSIINGETLQLEIDDYDDQIEWVCYSDTIPDKHLPSACRSY